MIKNLLMDQRFFQAVADVDTLMQSNGLNEDSFLQGMTFNKSDFLDKAEVVEWLAKYGYQDVQVEDSGELYEINLYSPGTFDDIVMINIRRGVDLVIGKFIPRELSPFSLSLLNEKNDIQFSDKLPSWVELAKVVEGTHSNYGKVKITKTDLSSMDRNFKDGIFGVDIMIDFDHAQSGAAGWLKETKLSDDGETLLGLVKWTPKGALSLSSKEFRYFSPEFTLNYRHPHTGKDHGPTLLGGGLVNRPFLKMDAIVEMSENQNKENKMDKILLTEHNAIKSDLELKLSESVNAVKLAGETIKNLQSENVKLSEEIKTTKEENEKKELEASFQKLFSENKINAAQLKALQEGKSALEVVALAEVMNVKPSGDNSKGNVVLSEQEIAACKLMDITQEDYIKANYKA